MRADHSWHANPEELARYRSGPVGRIAAASIEAHLLACHQCRLTLSQLTGPGPATAGLMDTSRERRERMWEVIAEETDRRGWLTRIDAPWLRLSIGSPLLLAALVAVVVGLLAVPLLNAIGDVRSAAITLVALAPTAPVIGTLLAYRPEFEPAGSLTRATPQSGLRLVLIRSVVAAGVAIPAGLAVGVALPIRAGLVIGWLIPAVAMCASVVAVGTRVEPSAFGGVMAVVWVGAVVRDTRGTRRLPVDTALEELFVNHMTTQVVALLVLVSAAAVITARWHERLSGRLT